MTFNPMTGKAVIDARQFLGKDPSVIELGSQTLTFRMKERDHVDTVQAFYKELGFVSYDAVDFDGRGTIEFDLNEPMPVSRTFDLVTNNGTGEHIFNQAAVFKTCHDLCKQGGVMVHILPWINWRNHGFYNFNPILFKDLAAANGYEILKMYAGDRGGNITHPEVTFKEDKKPDPIDKNIMLVSILRKTGAGSFCYPIQGKYQSLVKFPEAHSILSRMKDWKKTDHPFPFVVGKLDDEYTGLLTRKFPDPDDIVLGRDVGNNILLQRSAREVLADESTDEFWREFFELHTSLGFFQDVVGLFPEIRERYPSLGNLRYKTGVRFRDDAPFSLDCQFAVNTPVIEARSVRGPHVDDPKQIYAFLVYIGGGGTTNIYRWKKDRVFSDRESLDGVKMMKRAECDPSAVEVIAKVECTPGTVIGFVNTPDALHGVEPRQMGDGYRTYLNIIGEAPGALFSLEALPYTALAVAA